MDRDQAIGADGAQTAKEIMENELVMQTDAYKMEKSSIWNIRQYGTLRKAEITALDVMLSDLEESLLKVVCIILKLWYNRISLKSCFQRWRQMNL